MSLISTSLQSTLRGFVEQTMDADACQIQENVNTSDGQGGKTAGTWSTVATVDCELIQKSGRGDVVEGAKGASVTRWVARLPLGAEVTTKNRLLIAGVSYEVLEVDHGRSNPLAVTCQCKRLG